MTIRCGSEGSDHQGIANVDALFAAEVCEFDEVLLGSRGHVVKQDEHLRENWKVPGAVHRDFEQRTQGQH